MLAPERSAQPQVPMDVGRNPLDLTPLRFLGSDALDTTGFPALIKIILRELEISWPALFHHVTISRADNLFDCSHAQGAPLNPIPETGVLLRAVFDVQFADSAEPRPVEIRTPHLLKIVRASDANLLEPWLLKRGFRTAQKLSASPSSCWLPSSTPPPRPSMTTTPMLMMMTEICPFPA